MKTLFKYLTLFLIYGSIYYLIESIYKHQWSDWRMAVLGGVCAILIGLINNLFTYDTSLILQCFVGMMIILLGECITGYIYNIEQGLAIWDYSSLPFSYVGGQINLFFAIAWFFLSGVAIFLDDYLRYKLFGEERPHYTLWGVEAHQ